MGYLATSDPPDSFDWIEFGRVGWQKDKYQTLLIGLEKLFEYFGSVPSGIVQDNVQLAAGALEEIAEEVAEGFGVECGGLLGDQAPRFQVQCPEVADLLTG